MNKKQRLTAAFDGALPDRPPILGGWLAAPEYVQRLTDCSEDDYWSDPYYWGREAEKTLGTDGVITIFTPVRRGEFRCVDENVLDQRASYDVASMLAEIESMPTVEEMRSDFDEEMEYDTFIREFKHEQEKCGDMLWCPADWWMIPTALWYSKFGYETALMTLGLYPDKYRKLIQTSAERGRQRATLRARAIREGIHPRAILCGEDICGQTGPMVSPDFLRREYWPLVEYCFEPLLEAGGKPIWHCDGDVRPILDDILASGVGGLQGFQPECGMELEWIRKRRTKKGDPLVIYGPMPVTTLMNCGSPDDMRAEVKRAMDLCRDEASLVFFTSNTITPDIPFENVLAYWQAVQESHW
jgi:hypothetical protein